MSNHDKNQENIKQIAYNLARADGLSHEEALKKAERSVEYSAILSKQVQREQEILLQEEERLLEEEEYRKSPEYLELKSYYGNKAWKNFLQLIIFCVLIYFILKKTTPQGMPLTITVQNILISNGLLSIFAILFFILITCIKFFGNYIIGGVVGILAIGIFIDKAKELQTLLNITDEQLEVAFIAIGTIYFLANLIAFFINLKKSIRP